MTIKLRPATPDDADSLVELINIAGEGLPMALWGRQTDNVTDAAAVGRAQVSDRSGFFSWSKIVVAEVDGEVVGMIMSHMTDPDPVSFDESTPAVYRPLAMLESQVPSTRLIDAVSTKPDYRHLGVARSLISKAEKSAGKNGMSFIVPNGNSDARGFYANMGYREAAKAPLIRADWDTPSTEWVLLRKP